MMVNKNMNTPVQLVKILIVDLVTLNQSDRSMMGCEVADYIISFGGMIHYEDQAYVSLTEDNCHQHQQALQVHFFYLPHLSDAKQIEELTSQSQYDGVIAAATIIPFAAKFPLGGVRIGAGTGNMQSESFSSGSSITKAALMNTPSFNSQVTAQMVFKAILVNRPKVNWSQMHQQVVAGQFDTGRDLAKHPTKALFGYTIAILGFGHIGREVAKLAQSFAMTVKVFARPKHQAWIESLGYQYCQSPAAAATGADILSPHLGLGENQSNVGLIDESLLMALNNDALVVNFDRGELINTYALKAALGCKKVDQVVVDADIFVDAQGQCTGPLQDYRHLCDEFADNLTLLPHVAADIDHLSRVAGAKQAIKQLITAIKDKVIINSVGEIPHGFTDGGKQTLCGIGAISQNSFDCLDNNQVIQMAKLSSEMALFWQELADNGHTGDNKKLAQITRTHNKLSHLLAHYGLTGVTD